MYNKEQKEYANFTKNNKFCKKCGQLIKTTSIPVDKLCLDGYKTESVMCYGCNAVNSIVKRFNDNGTVTRKELEMLPSFLVFDPNNNNPQEEQVGKLFKNLVRNLSESNKK